MRYLALSLILAAAPALADSEFRQGADFVRITAEPCKDEKVLAHILPGDRSDYRAASAFFQGATYAGCWRPIFDKEVIYLRYEDGDAGVVPFQSLKPVRQI